MKSYSIQHLNSLYISQVGSITYVGPVDASSAEVQEPIVDDTVEDMDLLDDAILEEEEEEVAETKLNLTSPVEATVSDDGWTVGGVFFDSRICGAASGYTSTKAKIKLPNARNATPLDYFLFFLLLDHFRQIIENINTYASSIGPWAALTSAEYLMWIALLTVMTVIKHSDKKAYWRQGNSRFIMNIDFSKYMSFKRFRSIMTMHTLEVPSKEKEIRDPLYQIRSTLQAFNDHMADCVVPAKYLVVDESMNQWLGVGMPNLKKVPRKPHPIGQEFKTLADHHTSCILRLDTTGDPVPQEYDELDRNGRKKKAIVATVKRLVKPWIGTGRTVIADSWFGSPTMTTMLSEAGLFSIMQVCKRRGWPIGMPTTDIVAQVKDKEYGSHHYIMHKRQEGGGNMLVCAYRDQAMKAFISSCGISELTGKRTFRGENGSIVSIKRPQFVEEYETHKSKYQTHSRKKKLILIYVNKLC